MNKLKEMKKESVADGYYLTGLTGNVGIASNVITHAKIVYEKYVQRKTALSAYSLFDVAHDKYYDIQSQLLEHERLIDELKSIQPSKKQTIDSVMDDTIQTIETSNNIIQFGYAPLDSSSRGMTRKEITILGGRPGHGKTTLMVNVISSLIKQGRKVMVFSREMSKEELMKKLIILESRDLE